MIIKPYKQELDLWFRCPPAHNPDRDVLNFIYNKGDFSLPTVQAFEKHCHRLNVLAQLPFFRRLTGNRIKAIRKNENFWY